MIPKKRLSGEVVLKMTLGVMERHLSVKTEGYRSTTRQTQHVLLKAVASGHSVEAVCQDRQYPVSGNTLREQLNAALPVAKLREQEEEMNAALQATLPSAMPRGGLEVAIDTHDEPCYGAKAHWQPYTVKGRARAGTTRFLRLASAYVIWRNVRLTLALTYVLPEDDLPSVVERLLQRLGYLGLQATVAYLDKGFCSGEIIRYLQCIRQAAVLACPIRGKSGGIRALCQGRGSYTTDYTFTDGTSARLTLVDTRVPDPKTRRKHRKWLAFVCVKLDWTPQQVFDKYRRRFAVLKPPTVSCARSEPAPTPATPPCASFSWA